MITRRMYLAYQGLGPVAVLYARSFMRTYSRIQNVGRNTSVKRRPECAFSFKVPPQHRMIISIDDISPRHYQQKNTIGN